MNSTFRFLLFCCCALFISLSDIRYLRIPGILLLGLLLAMLVNDALTGREGIPLRLLAGAGAFALFFIVFLFKGGLGFADVKYAGVLGYVLGPYRVLPGLLCAVLLGMAVWCAGFLVFRWEKDRRFPFAPMLSAGAAAVYCAPLPEALL